ncbi:MAG TPA: hypothetical protein VGG39_06805 [Polyangiaceae bacterium]
MRDALAALLVLVLLAALGGALQDGEREARGRAPGVRTACEGNRAPLPTLFYELRAGAFPGSGHPDVAVHVPPGFDATRRPSLVVYFHGWNGCVETVMGDEDAPCTPGGDMRQASSLARQLDAARVNALLVAVELRRDAPTGEPGALASEGGLRQLVRELFDEHLAGSSDAAITAGTASAASATSATGVLGCPVPLEVDALDRVVVVAHSGGYQAAASVVARGEVPVTDVVLLDALYGADAIFDAYATDAAHAADADATASGPKRRFVDFYTCCGGTEERSRALAARIDGSSKPYAPYADVGGVAIEPVEEAHADVPSLRFGAAIAATPIARVEDLR